MSILPRCLTITRRDGVGIIALNRNVTNALNLELIHELSHALHEVEQDTALRGIVLTSTNDRFFSIGFDIPGLYGSSRAAFKVFYQAFNQLCIQLFSFPKPVIAAINGHAVAGGCILVLCCDYRYIAPGNRKMGLNEIKLGVPIPYPADRILRNIVGFRTYREVVDSGDFFLPETLVTMGLVDRIVPLERLQEVACEEVLKIGAQLPQAFSAIKQNRVKPVVAEIQSALRDREESFITYWYTEPVRQKLQLAMEKFRSR